MASTRKGGSDSSGKDKKPSKSFSRSNTAPTSSPLSTRTPKKPTTTNPKPQSPDKNVPNYLKPTLSSQSENSTSTSTPASTSISRFLKKQVPDDGSPKTSNRRRSFERPPSVQQSVVTSSPKGRISQPVSVRTTSFYPSSSTKAGSQSARAVSRDKPSQAPLKSNGSVPSSKPAKTSRRSLTLSAPSNKAIHHGKAPASKKAAATPSSVPAGYDDNEPLHLGDDIEEIASIGSDADLVPFDQIELSTSGDVNDCLSKKTTPREEDEHVPSPVAVQKEEEDVVNKQGEGEDMNNKSESGSDRKEQSPLAHPTDSTTPKREDHNNDKEGKISEEKEEEVKLAPVAAPVPEEGKQGVQEKGKKQSPEYNDVIKEAASKLLEKRKNKVSALVGAFETVISLQDTDS